MAAGLAALGIKRGDKIAIVGDNRPQLYWAMCAAQCLGAIPVPVYQDAVADEMAFVLDHAEARLAHGRGPGAGRQAVRACASAARS